MSEEGAAPLMVAPFRLDSLGDPDAALPPPIPPARDRGRHTVPTHRRRRRGRWLVFLAVLLLLVAAAAGFVVVRLRAPDAAPAIVPVMARTVSVPTQPVALPWPSTGAGAIAIPALGVTEASGPEKPVSVASLTKLMTAYVILRDHPLALHASGPTITVTQSDVDDYNNDVVANNSSALVALGEQLTESQVLGGLLVHSADNYADLLARWDAGSIPAFVDKMNQAAAQLGMEQSHFVDASGVNGGSQSTASDILKVATQDMRNPVFAADVQLPSITLPVAGLISSYTPLVGILGVIGVKSGYSSTAGGCDVLALERTVDGEPTLLLAAVTGQTGPQVLAQAGLHALALATALGPLIGTTTVAHAGETVAQVSESGQTVDASLGSSASLLTWPGTTATRSFLPVRHLTDQARRGTAVGALVVTLGTQRVVVAAHLDQEVPRESLLRRLF